MKEKVILVLGLFLILTFSISFVSAGFFSDFLKKFTGEAIGGDCGNGILETGEICDYAANDTTNNPYGDQCSLNCWVNGAPPYWSGCRGSGAHVCTDHPDITNQYFIDNPLCIQNPTCNNKFYTCNGIVCPEPGEEFLPSPEPVCGDGIKEGSELCDYAATDEINNPYGDRCSNLCWVNKVGTWKGCLGSGVHVCTEKVDEQYFIDNPLCIEHTKCLGLYERCDDVFCPEPATEPTNETANATQPGNETANATAFNGTAQNVTGINGSANDTGSGTTNETQTGNATSAISQGPEEPPPCTDSDGGLEYDEKGIVEDEFGNTFEDSCAIEGVGSLLIEYYCEENSDEIKFENHNCELGCFEGACIPKEGILSRIISFFVEIIEGEPDPISLRDPNTGVLVSGPPIKIEGDLTVDVVDDFENKQSDTIYIVRDGGEGRILNFIGEPPELLTGSSIKVTGLESESGFLTESTFIDRSKSGSGIAVSFASTPVIDYDEGDGTGGGGGSGGDGTGRGGRINKKIAVIMLNFKNDGGRPYSAEKLDNMMFSGKESVRSYYIENSYDTLYLSGDVFGWYTIDSDSDECEYTKWPEKADDLAKDSGVDLDDYDYKMYVFPHSEDCIYSYSTGDSVWGGRGEIGGEISWINGVQSLSAFIHEFGHNLGLHHANHLDCGLSQISESCNNIEYGDFFDVMGSSIGYFNAPHKNFLGLIPSHKFMMVTSSGTYTINSLESSDSNTQMLWVFQRNIPIGGESSFTGLGNTPRILSYFIEYRSPVGSNINLPEVVTRGVLITKGGQRTYLFDATPESNPDNDQLDSALMDGMSFYDVNNRLTITQISHDKDSATVSVEFGIITCMRKSPSIDVSYWSERGPTRKNYQISVINNDPPFCGGSREFDINIDIPLPLEITGPTDYSISLRPGETRLIPFWISGTPGIHEFSVEVTDEDGRTSSSKASYIDDISFTVNGTEYISINPFENITLEWTTSNNPNQCRASVTGCWGCFDYIDTWSGPIDSQGSKLEGPFSWPGEVFFYDIKCSYDEGYDNAGVVVMTNQLPPRITLFVAETDTIPGGPPLAETRVLEEDAMVENGTIIDLRWYATSNTLCTASGDWSGEKSASGSEEVGAVTWPNMYTYVLTCENYFGSDTKYVSLSVLHPPPDEGEGEGPPGEGEEGGRRPRLT